MVKYLLDTNHASKLMAKEEPIFSRVEQARVSGNQFGLSVTVLGELFFAAYASQHRDMNLQCLQVLLDSLILWSFSPATAEEFGMIQAEQKAKGRPIPPLDAQIAAVARSHRLTLLTADRHFLYVERLQTENWLAG